MAEDDKEELFKLEDTITESMLALEKLLKSNSENTMLSRELDKMMTKMHILLVLQKKISVFLLKFNTIDMTR